MITSDVPIEARGVSTASGEGGVIVPLPESGQLVVGRSFHDQEAAPQLRLRSPCLARRHATFLRDGADWHVRDDESPGGFLVDDAYVTRGRGPHSLHDGARIRFGDVYLTFRV